MINKIILASKSGVRKKILKKNNISCEVIPANINEDQVDISLNVEEKQTGTFNAGVSVGSLDGLAVIVGLSERNFYGTGRSLNALINTSDTQTEYTLETTDRLNSSEFFTSLVTPKVFKYL